MIERITCTAPWMGEELRTAMTAFIERQQAMLDPKDDSQREWLSVIAKEMEESEKLFQPWMSAPVFCWAVIQNLARENMTNYHAKRCSGRKVLILVKAQHPLTEEGKPGDEYRLRLDRAMEVGEKYFRMGYTPTYMVVGGKHAGHETTLADAGARYLKEHGKDNILRQVAVFSGNDEDWLACEEYLNDASYYDLIIVGSTGQYARSYMACLLKGIVPKHELVCFVNPHQDPILELSGPWSVGGYFEKGPMEMKRAAIETARRHKEEAEAKWLHSATSSA